MNWLYWISEIGIIVGILGLAFGIWAEFRRRRQEENIFRFFYARTEEVVAIDELIERLRVVLSGFKERFDPYEQKALLEEVMKLLHLELRHRKETLARWAGPFGHEPTAMFEKCSSCDHFRLTKK